MLDIDNWQVHHDFNHTRMQGLLDGSVTLSEDECPCADCVTLLANKKEPTLMDRALASSTQATRAQGHGSLSYVEMSSNKAHDAIRFKYEDNFKHGWD